MSDWIDLNLPYNWNDDCIYDVPPPNLTIKAKKALGMTPREAELMLKTDEDKNDDYLSVYGKVAEEYDKAVNTIRKECGYEISGKELVTKLHALNNDLIERMISYDDFICKYDEWECEQPEMIEWHNNSEKFYSENIDNSKTKSFCGLGLNKPGTLIEVVEEHNGSVKEYLIGNITENCGICDHCTAFAYNTVVRRYKIVYVAPTSFPME